MKSIFLRNELDGNIKNEWRTERSVTRKQIRMPLKMSKTKIVERLAQTLETEGRG